MEGKMLIPRLSIIAVLFLWLAEAGFSQTDQIEIRTDFEGANPKDKKDIIQEGPCRFRLKPFNEEGSNDAYYFRFDTKVVNKGKEARDVELIVEWPVLARQPDYEYDTYFYGDTGDWHWTYANIDSTEARLVVPVPPGSIYVCFYPRYSYDNLEKFMGSLKESGILEKKVEGKSFYGRDIWSVRMTDPSVPDEKKKVLLLTARNHPYETGGSFIIEEIIRYLESGGLEAENLLKGNVFYFQPMMNPDGVALGTNQRTRPGGVNLSFGADSDDPAAVTLRNLVRRINPGLWADIHSWPHQGDDGMWSTQRWVADSILARLPDSTFQNYVWNVSFVTEKNTPDNHLWRWLNRNFSSGGVSLSFSWYRRTEQDMKVIARSLVKALGEMKMEK
jgi:hypothetical protein